MRLEDLTTSERPQVDESAFVAPSADLIGDVRVAEHASVWYGCVLRADIAPISVGRETNIQDLTVVHVDPGRPTVIGERVGIGHRAIIHGCEIQDECLIGMGAIVLSHAVIGSGSVIAASSRWMTSSERGFTGRWRITSASRRGIGAPAGDSGTRVDATP